MTSVLNHAGLRVLSVAAFGAISISSLAGPVVDASSISYHKQDAVAGHTYVMKDSAVFVVREGGSDAPQTATYFFSGAIDKETLVTRMLWILSATQAPSEFQEWARKTLPRNWRLEQDSFVMPLRSEKYGTHEFTYSNTGHNEFYVLTYRRTTASQYQAHKDLIE